MAHYNGNSIDRDRVKSIAEYIVRYCDIGSEDIIKIPSDKNIGKINSEEYLMEPLQKISSIRYRVNKIGNLYQTEIISYKFHGQNEEFRVPRSIVGKDKNLYWSAYRACEELYAIDQYKKESKMLKEGKRPVLLQKYIEKGIKGAVDDFILDWDYRDFYISDPCPTTTYMGNDATEDFIFDIGFDKITFEVEAIEPLDVSSRGMMSNDNQIKLTLNIYEKEGEYEKTFTTHAFGVYDTTLEWFIDCLFGDGIWVDENETNINNLNENKIKRNTMHRRARLTENKLPSYARFRSKRMLRESEDKIDEIELERYIWAVAEDCAKSIKEQLLDAVEKDYFEKDEFGEHIEIDVYLPSVVRKKTLPYFLENLLYKDLGLAVLNIDITLDEEDKRTGEAFIWFGEEYDDDGAITEFIDYTETGRLSETIKDYMYDIIWNSEYVLDIIELQESRSRLNRSKRKSLKESSKRKSFRGSYAKKTLKESSKRFPRARGKRVLKEDSDYFYNDLLDLILHNGLGKSEGGLYPSETKMTPIVEISLGGVSNIHRKNDDSYMVTLHYYYILDEEAEYEEDRYISKKVDKIFKSDTPEGLASRIASYIEDENNMLLGLYDEEDDYYDDDEYYDEDYYDDEDDDYITENTIDVKMPSKAAIKKALLKAAVEIDGGEKNVSFTVGFLDLTLSRCNFLRDGYIITRAYNNFFKYNLPPGGFGSFRIDKVDSAVNDIIRSAKLK